MAWIANFGGSQPERFGTTLAWLCLLLAAALVVQFSPLGRWLGAPRRRSNGFNPTQTRAVRVSIITISAIGYGIIPHALGSSPGFLPLFLSFGASSLLVVTLDWSGRRSRHGENWLAGARTQ
jgi:zinc transporter ZupT